MKTMTACRLSSVSRSQCLKIHDVSVKKQANNRLCGCTVTQNLTLREGKGCFCNLVQNICNANEIKNNNSA